MNFKLLIFVSGIIQSLGRPTTENDNTENYDNVEKVFLLPAVFNVNDIINITIQITDKRPEEISIDFMGEDNKDVAFFSIKTDLQSVTIIKEKQIIKQKMDSVIYDGDKMIFNIWLQRRENKQEEGENNVIQVNTKYYPFDAFTVDYIENIRYLKLSGGNAKMINLGFEFA